MIISLLGFMGTGKSSIGRKLANKLNYKFVDTDQLIIEKAGITISEIFINKGEKYFRSLEEEVLNEILISKYNMILATGGGIVLSASNRSKLKKHTCPVLLRATPEEIMRRIDINIRPLLANAENPRDKIRRMMKERKNFYDEFETKVNTDNMTEEQVVAEIIKITGVEKCDRKNKS